MAEEENKSHSEEERQERSLAKRGGRIIRHEPTNTRELMASPITMTSFKHVGCFEFCEKAIRIQHYPVLTKLFITNLHENQVTLVGITFTISPVIISAASGIPNVGGKWFKQGELDNFHYEPYLKPRYKNERKRIFLSLTS